MDGAASRAAAQLCNPVAALSGVPSPGSEIQVSVVVPTRNEAESIDGLIGDVLRVAAAAQLEAEVVVVDGGSTDGTQQRVLQWERRARVRLVEDRPDGDLSSSVLLGADSAIADVVVVMDADGSHPVDVFPALVREVTTGACGVAIGSRYVEGSAITGWPLLRRIVSHAAAVPARLLTDARDPLAGYFAMRRDRLVELGSRARGFKILLEVLVHGGDALRVREVPIEFRERAKGTSKASSRVARSYLQQVARLSGLVVRSADVVRTGIAAVVLAAAAAGCLAIGWSPAAAHFVAGLLAAAAIGGSRVGRSDTRPVTGAGSAARLAALSAVTVGLGASVLSALLDAGIGPLAAMLPVALVESVLLGIGVVLAVRPGSAATRDARFRVVACSVVGVSLLLRLGFAATVQVLPEEAYYWSYSEHPALSYFDHPPMIAWLLRAATTVLGRTEFAVRLVAIGCWTVALVFTAKLTRRIAGVAAACAAAMLLSVLPFFLGAGFVAMPDSPLIACWAGALWYLHGALIEGRPRAWWGAGICVGLGLLSKYPIGLLAIAAFGFMLLDARSRPWLRRPHPYLAAALALALFSPVLIWNQEHGWASFAFQSSGRFAKHRFDPGGFAGTVLWALTPLGVLALVHGLRSAELDPRVRRFAGMLSLAPLGVFAIASLQGQVRINWAGPCLLASVPVMSWAVVTALRSPADRLRSAIAATVRPTVAVCLVVFALIGHALTMGVPWFGYPSSYGVGWRDLACAVDRVEQDVAQGSDRVVIAGLDRYKLTSVLAFYDAQDGDEAGDVFASANVVGEDGAMFDYWAPRESLRGRTVILVGDSRHDVAKERVGPWFERLGRVEVLPIRRRGQDVGEWYVRVGYGYRAR